MYPDGVMWKIYISYTFHPYILYFGQGPPIGPPKGHQGLNWTIQRTELGRKNFFLGIWTTLLTRPFSGLISYSSQFLSFKQHLGREICGPRLLTCSGSRRPLSSGASLLYTSIALTTLIVRLHPSLVENGPRISLAIHIHPRGRHHSDPLPLSQPPARTSTL